MFVSRLDTSRDVHECLWFESCHTVTHWILCVFCLYYQLDRRDMVALDCGHLIAFNKNRWQFLCCCSSSFVFCVFLKIILIQFNQLFMFVSFFLPRFHPHRYVVVAEIAVACARWGAVQIAYDFGKVCVAARLADIQNDVRRDIVLDWCLHSIHENQWHFRGKPNARMHIQMIWCRASNHFHQFSSLNYNFSRNDNHNE